MCMSFFMCIYIYIHSHSLADLSIVGLHSLCSRAKPWVILWIDATKIPPWSSQHKGRVSGKAMRQQCQTKETCCYQAHYSSHKWG